MHDVAITARHTSKVTMSSHEVYKPVVGQLSKFTIPTHELYKPVVGLYACMHACMSSAHKLELPEPSMSLDEARRGTRSRSTRRDAVPRPRGSLKSLVPRPPRTPPPEHIASCSTASLKHPTGPPTSLGPKAPLKPPQPKARPPMSPKVPGPDAETPEPKSVQPMQPGLVQRDPVQPVQNPVQIQVQPLLRQHPKSNPVPNPVPIQVQPVTNPVQPIQEQPHQEQRPEQNPVLEPVQLGPMRQIYASDELNRRLAEALAQHVPQNQGQPVHNPVPVQHPVQNQVQPNPVQPNRVYNPMHNPVQNPVHNPEQLNQVQPNEGQTPVHNPVLPNPVRYPVRHSAPVQLSAGELNRRINMAMHHLGQAQAYLQDLHTAARLK